MTTEIEKNEFISRDYQSEILDIAVQGNTIVYLPTGAGKTYIAIMLINRLSRAIIRPNNKITVFLVNNVPLVEQHYFSIKRHTDFEVGRFSGEQNIDARTNEQCYSELLKYQVIVLTAQIFLDMVLHGQFSIERVNLMIFDECHQAVENQPMRQIMKLFENIPVDKQPRVVGLTATLLNGNCSPLKVQEVVRSLETTLQSKVATVRDLAQIIRYSTNPEERIVYFQSVVPDKVLQKAINMVTNIVDFVSFVKWPRSRHLQNKIKELTKLLGTLVLHMEMLGIFGAWKSTFACIVSTECLKRHTKHSLMGRVLNAVTTTLSAVMALLEQSMAGYTNEERIFKFSSPQVLMLIETLRAFRASNMNSLCGIVFVQKRFTAKVLFSVVKALADCSEEFSYIRTDFMVGFSANSDRRATRELPYWSKINKRIVRNFYNGEINLLIASNVVEEGIDVPRCSLVVKFDRPMDYRSYIQSKGRARASDSLYVIMVPVEESKYVENYQTYKAVQEELLQYLVGQTHKRQTPSMCEIEEDLYKDRDVEPYYVSGHGSAHVTASSAIQLMNRYCHSLHRDRYSKPTLKWYFKKIVDKYSVVIEMPSVCPLREPIEGPPMTTKGSAKRVAALEVCKRLHQIGELNNNLLPITKSEDLDNYNYLFTNGLTLDDKSVATSSVKQTGKTTDEKLKETPEPKAGTKKFIRQHKIHIPKYLVRQPTTEAGKYYLHLIKMAPVPTSSTSNLSAELDILSEGLGYGLITLNKLPSVCAFPIFVSNGEISIELCTNAIKLYLTHEDILVLRKFNYFIMNDLLKIMKNFLVYDNADESGMMLLIPVKISACGSVSVEMKIAKQHTRLKQVNEPTLQEKLDLVVTEESHDRKIVWPWHRISEMPYFVSKICYNLNAHSPFPIDRFPSYAAYFKDIYQVDVKNPTQPLLQVKAISKRLNYILPQSITDSKHKKQDVLNVAKEFLAPELCVLQDFPTPLWYKASLLPTIMHRIMCLLQAESLRADIVTGTGVKLLDLEVFHQTSPMRIDKRIMKIDEQKIQQVQQRHATETSSSCISAKSLTNEDYSVKMLEKQYPWTDEEEPLDIERNLDALTLGEIECFEKFFSTPLLNENLKKNKSKFKPSNSKFPALTVDANYEPRPILMLREVDKAFGPPQWVIFQCLMAAKATDILNLERLEILGDSFLKLSVSLFLLLKYPQFSEGRLVYLKDKIVANRNLSFCGLQKNLGGYMKVSEFSPRTEWLPPGMRVPQILQYMIDTNQVSVNKLFEFTIPQQEQISGEITKDTTNDIVDLVQQIAKEAGEEPDNESSMNHFLGYQNVSDKTVSDCVEALIGAYLHSDGPKGALALMGWLGVIPVSENPTALFTRQPPSPLINLTITEEQINYHIPNYAKLEKHLGYQFKNRAYLLQALTHASDLTNNLTNCYQRLEFLGDAILDFLITCHIYEMSDTLTPMQGRIVESLTPGQLTDLRSALVNNATFAGLVVRNGFHTHLKYNNTQLKHVIDIFVKFQEERDFVINEHVLILSEDEPYMAEHVNVPKTLGDLLESLAGAVFLDTGMDLQATWSVFYKLMWREIETFRRNVPKSAVRMLHENVKAAPIFGDAKVLDNGVTVISCSVMVNGKKREVHGFGDTKALAKRAAAKLALRQLACN